MRFPTMRYMHPAKAQISMRTCIVWKDILLVALMFYDCLDTRRTTFGVSKLQKGFALARKSQHLSKCHDTLVFIAYAQNPIGPSLCSSCLLKAKDLYFLLNYNEL